MMTDNRYQIYSRLQDELPKIEKSIEEFKSDDSIMKDLGLGEDSGSIMKDLGLVSNVYQGRVMISLLERCDRIDRNMYNLSKSVMNDEEKMEEVSRFWRKSDKVLSMVDEECSLLGEDFEKEHSDCGCLDE